MIEVSEAKIRTILASNLAEMSEAMRLAELAIDAVEPGAPKDAMMRGALRLHLAVCELPAVIAAGGPFASRKALRRAVDESVRSILSQITSVTMTLAALGVEDGKTKTD
jgi:hypothetical protein